MKRSKKFNNPYDLSHSILFNEYPQTYTKIIGVPGKFVKKINRRVHLKDGTTGEMDSAYIADPDGKLLFERVAVGLEHQTKVVDNSKQVNIGNYDTQLVVNEHLPTLMTVASHLSDKESKTTIKRSPSDITEVYFLDLSEENITERLSIVSEIINNNQYLSEENALNLGVIILYAPRDKACEITESVVNLYLKISQNLDFKMEHTLYSVITLMIDAYFDDEKEYRRLTTMIDDNTSVKTVETFASHEVILESMEYAKQDLETTRKDLETTKENLKTTKEDLETTKEDLETTKEDLSEAQKKIIELEAENAMLKEELNGK